jgi:hypothetical protein
MLDVTCAPLQRHGPLTVFPLIARGSPSLPYELMADALEAGTLKITEVGSGTVPTLAAVNLGDASILVLDGEQLVGARQNRTTNRSLILPPHSETPIPVSCMEQGRWHHRGEDFRPTRHSSPSSVRRQAKDVEALRVATTGSAPVEALADAQGAVWSSISSHASALSSSSPTSALNDLVEARTSDIETWAEHFPLRDRQVGLLAYLGDRPLGLDVIGCTRLFGATHGRILRGYIVDALSAGAATREPTEDHAQLFLSRVNVARRGPSPTVGEGEYAVLSGEIVGGELTSDPGLVHLAAFPANVRPIYRRSEGDAIDPLAPPSRRRRYFE